jgi:hypothetical protein
MLVITVEFSSQEYFSNAWLHFSLIRTWYKQNNLVMFVNTSGAFDLLGVECKGHEMCSACCTFVRNISRSVARAGYMGHIPRGLNNIEIKWHTSYMKSIRTSQETHHVTVTETNWLMMFRETVAVYCENSTQKHSVGRKKSFSMLKQVVYRVITGL